MRYHLKNAFQALASYPGDDDDDGDDSGDGGDGGGDGGDSGDEIPLEKYLPSSNLLPRWFSS